MSGSTVQSTISNTETVQSHDVTVGTEMAAINPFADYANWNVLGNLRYMNATGSRETDWRRLLGGRLIFGGSPQYHPDCNPQNTRIQSDYVWGYVRDNRCHNGYLTSGFDSGARGPLVYGAALEGGASYDISRYSDSRIELTGSTGARLHVSEAQLADDKDKTVMDEVYFAETSQRLRIVLPFGDTKDSAGIAAGFGLTERVVMDPGKRVTFGNLFQFELSGQMFMGGHF